MQRELLDLHDWDSRGEIASRSAISTSTSTSITPFTTPTLKHDLHTHKHTTRVGTGYAPPARVSARYRLPFNLAASHLEDVPRSVIPIQESLIERMVVRPFREGNNRILIFNRLSSIADNPCRR